MNIISKKGMNRLKNSTSNDKRVESILNILEQKYPDPKPALNFSSAFELLIATILSAQSTDRQVNIVTAQLFKKYHIPEDFAQVELGILQEEIKSCGLFKNKSKNIIEASKVLIEKYEGEVPANREALMMLPGVGRKTANVVLSNAFNQDAIAVDTHVFRVANRLGLASSKNVLETEKQLMAVIPQKKWSDAHHWLIFHGRHTCASRNPKCYQCLLKDFCPFEAKNLE